MIAERRQCAGVCRQKLKYLTIAVVVLLGMLLISLGRFKLGC